MADPKDPTIPEENNSNSNKSNDKKKEAFSDQFKTDDESTDKKKEGFSDQFKTDDDSAGKSESNDKKVDSDKTEKKKENKDEDKSKLKVSPKSFDSEKTEEQKETEKIKKRMGNSFSAFFANLYALLTDILDIRAGSNVEKTNQAILDDIEFRGANVWALVASIIIASIGLNINSTAVVIGAMLISPLMGPIIGAGWSVAVNDLDALKKSVKNFLVMVIISIITSTVYFFISPLSSPSAELIGRTSPTILDLFIAFFGGVAGIVSMSKTGKVNVILGVAIATALIPPLCTAGYGIAEGRMDFFAGASYLFLINSVFIALASFIMIRYLRFPLKEYLEPKKDKKVKRLLFYFGILVMIPSAYTFYNSIMLFRFNSEAERFVKTEINHNGSKVLKMETITGDSINVIELYMIGVGIDSLTLSDWNNKLSDYKLKNTILHVFQDRDISSGELSGDLEQIVRTGIIEDLYRKNQDELETKDRQIRFLERTIAGYKSQSLPVKDIGPEAKSIIPLIDKIALGESYAVNDTGKVDTIYSIMVTWKDDKKIRKKQKSEAKEKLGRWISVRLKKDTVLVLDIN